MSGIVITTVITTSSGLIGWSIERLAINHSSPIKPFGLILVLVALASSLAAKSLRNSVLSVINNLSQESESEQALETSRKKLQKIVGRDVSNLDKTQILRACAETASENSVDGVFAPLFWIFVGTLIWKISTDYPGPVTFAWIFKASSTLDSMIGYKHGRLKWLGTAGARLDDFLTWIPCRLVMFSLPLASNSWAKVTYIIKSAWNDGSKDDSPNSGIAEATFAYCAKVKMGGENVYSGQVVEKPLIAKIYNEASIESVMRVLNLSIRLEIIWVFLMCLLLELK